MARRQDGTPNLGSFLRPVVGPLVLGGLFTLGCIGSITDDPIETGESGDDLSTGNEIAADDIDEIRPPADAGQTVHFGAAGDFGGRDEYAGTVMTDMLSRDLSAFFLLGDMSYSEIAPEQAWCDWIHNYLGADYPLQVVAGNHEEDRKTDGYILNFADCMPDRLNSELGPGGYSVNYASDLGPVTFIATSPDLRVDGVKYNYAEGTSERDWLINTIDSAKQEGDWVVVGMHKNCVTIGNKTCEIGQELPQLLIDRGVNLVMQGHDHDYQRTHGLKTMVENSVGVIGDTGDDGMYARDDGTVFVIVGTAGRGVTPCSHEDNEFGNFAAHWCGEEATNTKGYLLLSANGSRLTGQYVTTTGAVFDDVFVIE